MAKGLMTNAELIDSLVEDINNGIRQIINGNFVGWNAINVQMVQKLTNLKKGVISDINNREETIAELKKQLRSVGVEVVEIPAEELLKEGEQNGGH